MEWELRIVLGVIGVIIIGVVAFDGYRKSQKKKQLKQSLKTDFDPNSRDNQGFDLDGVGEVRVRKVAATSDQVSVQKSTPLSETIRREPQLDDDDTLVAKRDDFIAEDSLEDEAISTSEDTDADDEAVEPELIFSLTLLAEEENAFHGQQLLSQLIENGCRFGDMNIFHRYKASNSTKNKYFSVANAFNPGVFDLDNMQNESYKGISFFMGVPGPAEPDVAYRAMVEAARGIKKALGGKIMDSRRSVFTEQTYQHELEQINEYRRKTLTKS